MECWNFRVRHFEIINVISFRSLKSTRVAMFLVPRNLSWLLHELLLTVFNILIFFLLLFFIALFLIFLWILCFSRNFYHFIKSVNLSKLTNCYIYCICFYFTIQINKIYLIFFFSFIRSSYPIVFVFSYVFFLSTLKYNFFVFICLELMVAKMRFVLFRRQDGKLRTSLFYKNIINRSYELRRWYYFDMSHQDFEKSQSEDVKKQKKSQLFSSSHRLPTSFDIFLSPKFN